MWQFIILLLGFFVIATLGGLVIQIMGAGYGDYNRPRRAMVGLGMFIVYTIFIYAVLQF